ncbi:MAG: DNA methylase [Spirochaetes bacterium]|nr:DNA methylase [Spirochaetota bacterium]
MSKQPLHLQTTTLWDYPSQHYKKSMEPAEHYKGATPAYIIWNLLSRYTKPKDLVVDPMCGSGTTIDVARDLNRKALGYDINIVRNDVFKADARKLPLENEKADFVFIDPPYSTHIRYSGSKECIGELSAKSDEYYKAMNTVLHEINRILRPDRYMALYVSDSFEKGKPVMPIGFTLFSMLSGIFVPVDIISVKRHNATLQRNNWHKAAAEQNYFLRGFNYLFVMFKPSAKNKAKTVFPDRRSNEEKERQIENFEIK